MNLYRVTESNQPRIALLTDDLSFPPLHESWEGLLAVGGDLSEARLIAAYEAGVFPWYGEEDPILWWAPEKRSILHLDELNVSKSMRNILNRGLFEIRMDTSFEQVVRACGDIRREGEGTWISEEITEAYMALHRLGLAHSVETWHKDKLVGGLYGISIGRMFFGESMFSLMTNASKVAFIHLVRWAKQRGFGPIDCQVQNPHLATLGAREIERAHYMEILEVNLKQHATIKGPWSPEIDPIG
ncbi:MAG: leucyl/phenylalanyl-tRNA--protein transferase [Flavobacteriales bacterium]|nr:leucyl/phenylalanyl-tRNA--protein transferase [Flavobacteriales bacterium]